MKILLLSTSIILEVMMQPIEEPEMCCFGLFTYKPRTYDEMEWLSNDNDNYVKFKIKNSTQDLTHLNGEFYSSSESLGKNHLLVRKVSPTKNCSIVLIYKDNDGKLVLIEGTVITEQYKFKVKEFIIGMKMEFLEKENKYEYISNLEVL